MTMAAPRGKFLTLEGVDGAGKSSHLDALCDMLREQGVAVVLTREPGGTPLAEKLRTLLLHEPMQLTTEALLMFAARAEHLHDVIEPALRQGQWVLCDRFTDATYAYQGGGRGLGVARVAVLEQWLHPHLQPDRTWLFDLPLSVARERLLAAREADRFESEAADFFERTRAAYLERARLAPERFRIIDAQASMSSIREHLRRDVDELLNVARRSA